MTQTLPPKFDAFDPEVLDDPYPVYARLRAAGALCRGGPATWVVTRHAEVSALLKDRRLGHTFPEGFRTPFAESGGAANRLLQRIVSSLDPPDHTRVRRGVAQAVNPATVRGLRDTIAARVDALLRKEGTFDAVTDLALPLQIAVGCDLIGIPEADRDEVWPRAVAIGRAFIPMAVGDSGPADDGAADWLGGYVRGLVERRRRESGDDVVSRMLDGSLSDDEIVDNTVFLFFAGFETAMYLVAGGCLALARDSVQQQRLRADPTLLPSAVEEIVRYDAPIQSMARMVVEPIEIGGRTVKAGRALVLLIGSANHDERAFADPGRFDVGRRPNPHLGFGGGAHHCLGVGLARLEGEVVFDRLLRRYATLAPDGDPVRRPHPNLRGYTSVPLRVR
jgi:cytochrome P450